MFLTKAMCIEVFSVSQIIKEVDDFILEARVNGAFCFQIQPVQFIETRDTQ